MEFPITGVVVNPLLLVGIGFLVGILGGFFGVGGGFIAGPLMFSVGVPANFVVGTDLAHMTGKSIVAAKRHRVLGHVDVKLGILMIAGTVPGVELGARIIEQLENSGSIDQVLGITYIVVLLLISFFTGWESLRAIHILRSRRLQAQEHSEEVVDVLAFASVTRRVQHFRLRPMISFPTSGIESISLWVVLGVGFVTGVLAGMLGVGGGFIRMPMLLYFIGVPTHVAVGTDLFEIIFSAGFGTLTHAVKGNVDVLMALIMQTGAAVGAQIGAVATRYFVGPRIRLLFAFLPLIGAALVVARLVGAIAH